MKLFRIFLSMMILLLTMEALNAQSCPEMEKAPSDERALVALLSQEDHANQNADCVTYAIRRLGELNSDGKSITGGVGARAVVEVLVKYLDYKRAIPDFGPLGVRGNNEPYPAILALAEIGKTAQPALFRAIRNSDTTDTARSNAIDAFMYIHRDNQLTGVKTLKTAAKNEKEADAAQRLKQAVKTAATRCFENIRFECQKLSDED